MSLKRFLILAFIGFLLGAAIAYSQNGTPVTVSTTDATQAAPAAETASAETPPMPAAEAEAATAPAENAATDTNAKPEAVAGSSVGGAFALIDHNGNAVTETSWPGKKKLVFFGFTNCPDICPAGLDKIATALKEIGGEANQIQTLFITVDAARDTPDVMKEYVGKFDPSIIGLTGTEEQLKAVQDAYKVYAAKEETPAEESHDMSGHEGHDMNVTFNHSGYIYLMSADDLLLEIISSSEPAETLVAKIKPHLIAEPPSVATQTQETPAAAEPAINETSTDNSVE